MSAKNCLLSLSLIMRDAAEDILACLESVAAAVDEMVIVDTGSVDDSVKIVRRFLRKWQGEAPGRRGKLYDFQWRDDFSAAKNYALARCHGEFVLLLDSDESLSPETRGNLRPLVEKLNRQLDMLEIYRKHVDLAGNTVDTPPDYSVRLCRRQKDLRYRGEVHEQLMFDDGRGLKIATADREELTILHTGYRPGLAEKKEARNYAILMKEKQQGGSTHLLDYYLAEACLTRRDWAEALAHAKASLETVLPGHDLAAPYRIMYQAASAMEKEKLEKAGLHMVEGERLPEDAPGGTEVLKEISNCRHKAEQILEEAIGEYPDYPEFYYFRGGRRWNGGDEAGGRADLEKAWQLAADFPARHPEDAFRFRELLPSLEAALEQIK